MPMPSNISKSDLEKIVLIGVAAFIVLFILIQFAMVPSFRKLGSLKEEIVKNRRRLKITRRL